MTQNFAPTGRTYDGTNEAVPFPAYRCKATAQEKPGKTHLCRRAGDHEGVKHKCICGELWAHVGQEEVDVDDPEDSDQ